MIQRIINSKNFIAFLLASATGMALYFLYPFPSSNLFLRVIALRAPLVYRGALSSYTAMLFTTPYILYSILLSGLYIFTLRGSRRPKPSQLPLTRTLVCAAISPLSSAKSTTAGSPYRQRTLAGSSFLNAVSIRESPSSERFGTGKTSCCMYPFAEQLFAYKADNKDERIGGLVLEVKGDFCHKLKGILERHGRGEDYIEVSLDAEYRYNPLHNSLDAYALAYNVASLLNNLFGKGKEPFWQQAYTNLIKFIILLHKVAYDYVTFFDVYECAISAPLLKERIEDAERILSAEAQIYISAEDYTSEHHTELQAFHFVFNKTKQMYHAIATSELSDFLLKKQIQFSDDTDSAADVMQARKRSQLDAVKRWFHNDWQSLEPKLRTSIVEGISVFLSLFDDNPDVKRTFCPPAECFDPEANADHRHGKPLPSFSWLIENGKVCALNFPIGMNAGLARALGVMMKLDFERAVLNRIPYMEAHPYQHFRQVLFLCDEYQHFATVGENEPLGDEKFFSLSRQPKCIPIVATQSISSLKSALPGDSWRSLLQTFRTKIFFALSDDFSASVASELCGREDRLKVSYNISESGHDANVSFLSGKALSNRANVTTSKSYVTHNDYRFDTKTFAELKNAQSVTLAYDGIDPMPPTFCYLKPYYNDVNRSYFEQLARGEL